ncbi:MAG: DUF2752 domain-containing protein [Muribaculaceae bacterium]|nr:DUF2752 domain-containing protein [Muribaculaceae bacterium]
MKSEQFPERNIASSKRKKSIGITVAVTAAVVLILGVYGSIDPADAEYGRFFPKCPVKLLTGLDCPSCGLQRSLHALMHGDLWSALKYNWFVIFSFSYLGCVLISKYWRGKNDRVYHFFWGTTACIIYVVLYFLWFALRNIFGV